MEELFDETLLTVQNLTSLERLRKRV